MDTQFSCCGGFLFVSVFIRGARLQVTDSPTRETVRSAASARGDGAELTGAAESATDDDGAQAPAVVPSFSIGMRKCHVGEVLFKECTWVFCCSVYDLLLLEFISPRVLSKCARSREVRCQINLRQPLREVPFLCRYNECFYFCHVKFSMGQNQKDTSHNGCYSRTRDVAHNAFVYCAWHVECTPGGDDDDDDRDPDSPTPTEDVPTPSEDANDGVTATDAGGEDGATTPVPSAAAGTSGDPDTPSPRERAGQNNGVVPSPGPTVVDSAQPGGVIEIKEMFMIPESTEAKLAFKDAILALPRA